MEDVRQLPPTRKDWKPAKPQSPGLATDPTQQFLASLESGDSEPNINDATAPTGPVHTTDTNTTTDHSSPVTDHTNSTDHPNPSTTEEADKPEQAADEQAVDDDGCEPDEEDSSQVRALSAKSNVSLVEITSDSEHRSFLRRMKAEMAEQQQKAERRHSLFEERRLSVQDRAKLISSRRASRRLSQADGMVGGNAQTAVTGSVSP